MAMGAGACRAIPEPGLKPYPGGGRLAAGQRADLGRLRHDQPRAEHDPRRGAPLRAAFRRRTAHDRRPCCAGRVADDGGARTVGKPVLAAFFRPADALAAVRLAAAPPCGGGRYARFGAHAMTELPVTIHDVPRAENAIPQAVNPTPTIPAAATAVL